MRFVPAFQIAICVFYGMVSGAAIMEYAERERDRVVAEMLVSLSVEQLLEMRI